MLSLIPDINTPSQISAEKNYHIKAIYVSKVSKVHYMVSKCIRKTVQKQQILTKIIFIQATVSPFEKLDDWPRMGVV